MSREMARNIGIIVVLALVVWLAPGGGAGAAFIQQLLNAIFIVFMALGAGIFYRRFRPEIYSLGNEWRLAFYGAIGVAVVTVAVTSRLWATGAGAVVWLALIGMASYALYLVWQRYRAYA